MDHHPLLIGNVKLEKKDPPSLSAHDDFIIMHYIYLCVIAKTKKRQSFVAAFLLLFFLMLELMFTLLMLMTSSF